MKINIEKIKKELDKGTLIEMVEVFQALKSYVTVKLQAASEKLSNEAEDVSLLAEKL